MNPSRRVARISIIALLCIASVIWAAVLDESKSGVLTVSFLDVGQGDAIFIESPTGSQVLIDGGPGSAVLRKLSSVMPWYDRSVDMVIGTHADMDHISGLIEMLPRYRVGAALVPSTKGASGAWKTYLDELNVEEKSGTKVFIAQRGERIDIGGGAYLEVLFPDRMLPDIETNTGCIVTRLVYGDTSFMLSCDSPKEIENYLVLLDGKHLKSNVMKAGHHGSKNSSSPLFVGMVDPAYTVFSRGCDNKYGHPAPETVATFKQFDIPMSDTCREGTVTFVSDGQTVMRK